MTLYEHIKNNCTKNLDDCSDIEIYEGLIKTVNDLAKSKQSQGKLDGFLEVFYF